ncbi:MAG: threonylcarbamoyl-AMP synthase [Planctomycetes bacterium]|nr:threonylcarbamoyl-AMP synthase [Planctomycetota bacterium]
MATAKDIAKAAKLLKEGGVVAFPTETVYGLGADAFNEAAIARVFEIKNRPRFDPLIVHIADMKQLKTLARDIPAVARKLARKFWPGPLTLILPKTRAVPDIVTAGGETVGVRMPDHPIALRLIAACGQPVAAPSANPFGATSPTTAAHVREQLGKRVDMILDGGPCRVGLESTVVEFPARGKPRVLRPGGLAVEDIEAVVGPVAISAHSSSKPKSPGMLERHYAPRTRLVIGGKPGGKRVGLLKIFGLVPKGTFAAVEVLSAKGDLREAAAHLFAAMRRLDALKLDVIMAELAPEEGLGRAINDRLRRAAM